MDAGGSCSTWSAGDAVGPWAQYGNCGTYGAPDEAVLSIYSNDSDLKSSVDAVKSKRTGTMKQMLVGPNWVIQAADVTKVADKLGGTVVKVG